jgi:hypothetical protein
MTSKVDRTTIISNTLVLLGVINVMQPVTFKEINDYFAAKIKGKDIREIFYSLSENGYIRKISDDQYIASKKGIRAIARSPLKKGRDIQRMLFLTNMIRRGKD